MDVTPILAPLNDAQRAAVTAPPGHLLVLAGAGSGKTRVLVHRIAWLLATDQATPWGVFAVTFTNKAAAEMRGRIEEMLDHPVGGMWVGTFHGLAHRLLRAHSKDAGLPEGFQILDADDQLRCIRRVMRGLEIDEARWPPRQIQGYINTRKDEGLRPQHIDDQGEMWLIQMLKVYRAYQESCERSGLVDFAELLFRAHELLRDHDDIRTHYRDRFQHILVDEFQDTNAIQYAWLRMLAGERGWVFSVGDDDQCLASGTEIRMADGSNKAIETIVEGDTVLSSYGGGDFRAARVSNVFAMQREGPLLTVVTQGRRRIVSTPEHTHFAGYLHGTTPQTYFTYLMYKEGTGYRLGTSQVYTKARAKPDVGFKLRSVQEHADALWVIRTHASENEARLDEITTSLRYALPTLPFVARRGRSSNGLVHDPELINRVFQEIDTATGARRLLHDVGLDREAPHHRPQGRNSNRRTVIVTLCGDHRGRIPMHRISVVGVDERDRSRLQTLGLSVRAAKPGSASWRFETCRKDFGEIMKLAREIAATLDAMIQLNGHVLKRSLPFVRASAIRPGMAVALGDGGLDVVERVEASSTRTVLVFDLNIERTHNFVANGIVTHNSIYGWRGAKIENIHQFTRDFNDVTTVRLEQNYRSTGNILKAANALIGNNQGRLGKKLWTSGGDGEAIHVYAAFNDLEEARFVVARVQQHVETGGRRDETAVLYRVSAQSRVIEEALLATGIPYRVHGGMRFYERAEVKNALAYLRLVANRDDDAAFERVVNFPTRGIGARSVDELRRVARERRVSLWAAARALLEEQVLAARTGKSIGGFIELVEELAQRSPGVPIHEQLAAALERSGLREHYRNDKQDRAQTRVENLDELLTATRQFETEAANASEALVEFLAHAALEAGEDQAEAGEDCVHLMTMHAAKGLEFATVFVCGMEEGLFPHQRSADDPHKIEEERRLCYVGMTRAKHSLYLSHAECRHLHGSEIYPAPSRFLREIPTELLDEMRMRGSVSRPAWRRAASSARPTRPGAVRRDGAEEATGFRLGQRVRHAKFGEGVVLTYEGQGNHARIQVNFAEAGSKWLVVSFAKLEAV